MKNKILQKSCATLIITTLLLVGCKTSVEKKKTNSPIIETPVIEGSSFTTYSSSLLISGQQIKGDVYCNGERLSSGKFTVTEGDSFTCTFGSIVLGTFVASKPIASFQLTKENKIAEMNETKVLQSIDSCKANEAICLKEINSFDIEDIYQHLNDNEKVNAYFHALSEKVTDDIGKSPSSHVDTTIVPAVDIDASNDLNSKFISANAESSYVYKPSIEAMVLTTSTLTDSHNKPISGMNFYTEHSKGITDPNGQFKYKWGDSISFGIETFEFGKVKGNKINYKLSDVTDNPITKANIQAIIKRYANTTNNMIDISQHVHHVFSKYPNVINQLIDLSLPNGERLEGTNFRLPNDFNAQFNQGLTAMIDSELYRNVRSLRQTRSLKTNNNLDMGQGYVTQSLNKIFDGVNSFHVFNDAGSFYGASGYTRGMRALNISNTAFPIMMARTDKNATIPFGQRQAWTREGKPYIAEYSNLKMPPIPLVSKDNATYGFPFVTAGSIGKGKVVFMGNEFYPSILSCPENYWADSSIEINSETKTCTTNKVETSNLTDHDDMQKFFSNLFAWFGNGETSLSVATNIELAHFFIHHTDSGKEYNFFINSKYGLGTVKQLSSSEFNNISAHDTPILILQAYQPKVIKDGQTNQFVADLTRPNLDQDDVTALIKYINDGGNVLFMDAIPQLNPEPIGRLADASGISIGGQNVTPTHQAFCGGSYYCNNSYPNLHVKSQQEMVVLERFQDDQGKQPFNIEQDGSVKWIKDETKIKFEIPTYQSPKLSTDGKPLVDEHNRPILEKKYARIFVSTPQERDAAIAELQKAFKGTPVCHNSYEYEFNCIETRKGNNLTARGNYGRADFDRYLVSSDVIKSMVKSANLGSNLNALYNHEIYYRTKGEHGSRLSKVELNQAYDNLAVWMWNNNDYRYDPTVQDELGFKQAVQFLNCYTENQHQPNAGEATCSADLKKSLIDNNMIHGSGDLNGQLNPSYPLNYMEKPLTRIMLGRSYWDHQIKVDTTLYPGKTSGNGSSETATIQTDGLAVTYSAGNNQSTGLWAPQLQDVTIEGGVAATITVMMADDLTGKPKHELALQRPPRMQTSYNYDGTSLTFQSPYGGLIYIQPKDKDNGEVTYNISNVERAAWWKNGNWVYEPNNDVAPIAEIDTGSFIYTTPVNSIRNVDIGQFAKGMNRFANAASDFYGRDEETATGKHRRFTYPALKEFRHRFVNDVEISIGSAHSGYPVMSASFNADEVSIPMNAVNDWTIWHEIGHNLAQAPFLAEGSTEVTNNFLGLYMQELEGRNSNPRMDRIIFDIKKAPVWLEDNAGHAWSNGNAGMRLVMLGQLKIWAKNHFSLQDWYQNEDDKPNIYNDDAGWNMVKLMHRKARGDTQGDDQQNRDGTNYCSPDKTNLSGGDLMMLCSSYVSGYDLSDFFTTWNVGEVSATTPDGIKVYSGGISSNAISMLSKLNLKKPEDGPLKVNNLNYSK